MTKSHPRKTGVKGKKWDVLIKGDLILLNYFFIYTSGKHSKTRQAQIQIQLQIQSTDTLLRVNLHPEQYMEMQQQM